MRRLPVILSLLLLPLLAACGVVNPLTGNTTGGGQPTQTSRLLGARLPAGMEFYPEHSSIQGQDGREALRGSVSPGLCASTLTTDLAAQGWTPRLAYVTETRGYYAFERSGRLAVLVIEPQAPTSLTLVTICTASVPPAQPLPVPVPKKADYGLGLGGSSEPDPGDSTPGAVPAGNGGLETTPESSGIDMAPQASPQAPGSGQIQERTL